MRSHDGAVDHRVFVVGVCGEMLENPFPDAGLGPTGKPRVNLDRIAKPLRQVAPGRARLGDPQHGIDKQAIILGGDTGVSRLAR